MEELAADAKQHLYSYQATLKGRDMLVKSPPGIPLGVKWKGGPTDNSIMKLTIEATCTYMEQLEEYTDYLRNAIETRKRAIASVEKSMECVDQVLNDLKKRKEPEAEVAQPAISVVEVPVMKKPAPNVIRR